MGDMKILDVVFVADEMVEDIKRRNQNGLVLSLILDKPMIE